VDHPLAFVLPNHDYFDVDDGRGLVGRATFATLKHAQYLFNRTFDSVTDLEDYCHKLVSVDQVLHELKGADRLLFEAAWDRDPRTQLVRAISEHPPPRPGSNAGDRVAAACLGRMPQAMAAKENAIRFGGTPLITAETSWAYYTWLLDYEAARPPEDKRHGQTMHVVRAMVSDQHNNLQWLGNVPPETVIEIRKRGLADDLRALLGRGVADLIGVNPTNYFRTTDQVVENLERAFREHQRGLIEARQKKLMLYGVDVGSCMVVGGVAVAAALTNSAALGVVSGLLGVAGLPNLRDIKTKFSEIAAEDRIRRDSPTGLLFRHLR
jgi:hypothetical protein